GFLKFLSIFTNPKYFFLKNLKNPAMIFFFIRMIRWQKNAAHIRKMWKDQGVAVPFFMPISITYRCNLKCPGCYTQAQDRCLDKEMSINQLKHVLAQAKEIGIPVILILGGEPLVRQEILDIIQDFPEIIFPLLTNGLFFDESTINRIKKQKNIIPLISLEGPEQETDQRRGKGVFEHNLKVMEMMYQQKVFFGTSITITRRNFDIVLDEQFIMQLIAKKCNIIGFVEYFPLEEGTDDLRITEEQRKTKLGLIESFRAKFRSIFFIDLPGDEDAFGGCLFRDGGLVHVSADGHVEPCVFFPVSDSNLKDMPLIEALKSPILRTIRENGEQINDTKRACVFWENRELVDSTVRAKKAEKLLNA
ncbi:MAG: radical SAM/SPASM domain-containing protein, partial [Candidatus Hodarchaeota archaeon]